MAGGELGAAEQLSRRSRRYIWMGTLHDSRGPLYDGGDAKPRLRPEASGPLPCVWDKHTCEGRRRAYLQNEDRWLVGSKEEADVYGYLRAMSCQRQGWTISCGPRSGDSGDIIITLAAVCYSRARDTTRPRGPNPSDRPPQTLCRVRRVMSCHQISKRSSTAWSERCASPAII